MIPILYTPPRIRQGYGKEGARGFQKQHHWVEWNPSTDGGEIWRRGSNRVRIFQGCRDVDIHQSG